MNEIYTKKDRVFQRSDKTDPFNYSDGDETENYLLRIIEEAEDLSISSPHWNRFIIDWPTKYHLSPQRADLLRPFKESFKSKSILEVGCGCGAITRFLGESGALVTALEGSTRRCKITAARCRDLSNVNVVCDDFQDFHSHEKYDIIVLIGVLEYSNIFIEGTNSALKFLNTAKSMLQPGGTLIIGIENKLGLRYWAGAPEDHVGMPYFGIENRYDDHTPQTYGRVELETLLYAAGLGNSEFLYPFPDYKLPSIILREKSMQDSVPDPSNLIIPATDHPQFKSYHPNFVADRAWKEVINNSLTPDMANSFLVVASSQSTTNLLPDDTSAYIYSSGRFPPYRKANTFVQTATGTLIRRDLINAGYPARENAVLSQVIQDEDYIPGSVYFLAFQDIISKTGWTIKQLVDWCAPYYEYVMKLSTQAGHTSTIDGSFLDLTPFNLIKTPAGELKHFDQEWVAEEALPLRYVIFRGLYFCFSRPLYFMPPADGTPLNAFELINKIISAFEPDNHDASDEFCRLEFKYFGPVSMDPGYVPVNFHVNLFKDPFAQADYLLSLPIPRLEEVAVKCFFGLEGEEYLALNSISSMLELGELPMKYTFRFKNSDTVSGIQQSKTSPRPDVDLQGNIEKRGINKIRICLSDKPGLINFYSYMVKDSTGNALAMGNTIGEIPMQLRDIISIEAKDSQPHFEFIMFEGEPSIEISFTSFHFNDPQSYLDVIVELSQVSGAEHAELRHSLSNLLSVENVINPDETGKEPVRNQLASVSQRLSKNARADLDKRLSDLESQVDNLNNEMFDEHSLNETLQENIATTRSMEEENGRLQKTIKWYQETYEERSLAGIINTRFKNYLKNIYHKILKFFLGKSFVRDRYAINYMLEYTSDNGLRNALSSVNKNFDEHGFKMFTNARKLALEAMNRAAASKAPRPADPAIEDVYPPEKMKVDISHFRIKPLVSVIMPTYNTKPALLKLAIESIKNQVYQNWELCITDDGSTSAGTKEFLNGFQNDNRIKIKFLEKNVGISEASNEAIAMSKGDLIALFDHDDELTPDALYWICRELNEFPATDIFYTDECKKDEKGATSDYFLKPDWSPQLLLNMMYVGHLTVYKKSFLDTVGKFRSAFDFSQDYDLILRATEKTSAIRHIPKVLYYWRQTAGSAALGDKPYARESNLKALRDALKRRDVDADVIDLPTANRVKVNMTEKPLVSIIIPTDSLPNLTATINSITATTAYTNYEIVPVTNSGVIAELSSQYQDVNMNYVRYDKPYNFSDKCNAGAAGSNGPVLIFLNDDVRPLQSDWIENTIEYLLLPGVGGVSPKLIYEDDSIQYAGMVTGVRNLTGTSFHRYPANSTDYINFPQLTRDVSILSGACLSMKKQLFLSLGGFDAVNTPSAHSDVDLSFKIIEAGFRCIYTPYAELRHIGHHSLKSYEGNTTHKKDKADIFLLHRWPTYVAADPYFPYPMRDLLYHDSPVPVKIYPGTQRDYVASDKDVILVCHDLTRSGAPIMLYNICTVILKQGYFVVVCCAKDGPLKTMYTDLGVTVIIDPLILTNHESFEKFAINFNYIICNTVVNWPIVKQMQDKVKTIWWLQEAKVINHFINEKDFIPTLSTAYNIVGVSDYSLGMIKKYNSNYRKIYNACFDFYDPAKHDNDPAARINFTIVGSIESRKGHDVLFKALGLLEQTVLDRLAVQVVGRVLDPGFDLMIRQQMPSNAVITFTGEISNTEAVKLVAATDVIVCPSRDDPFPVVLVEGFCMAKTCLVSDATGFAELIEHGENGFVFASEDAEELADIMRNIVLRSSELEPIGHKARQIYLRELSMPVLEQRLLPYLEALPDPTLRQSKKAKVTYKKEGTTFQRI